MKRVLVTGGAGVIGSHLCRRLLDDGNQVVCIDSLLAGNRLGVELFAGDPNYDFVRHDTTSPFNVNADQIYHMASPSSPTFFRQNPVQTLRSIFLGTMNALELAKRQSIPIVIASSSDIYGYPRLPFEGESFWGNVNTMGTRSSIEEGKRAAESLSKAYYTQFRTKIKIARIFNPYGTNGSLSDSRVIPKFVINALRGNDITIYGTGQQTRCFCYADDIVEALTRLMNGTPDTFINPVNIGSTTQISIMDLAEKIIIMTGSTSKILHLAAIHDDPKHKTPDIMRARQILDWSPTVSLDHGLNKTIEYYKQLLSPGMYNQSSRSWVEMA